MKDVIARIVGNEIQRREIHFEEFPHYLKVFLCIDKLNDTVRVEIESTIHVNKLTRPGASWSIGYCQTYPKRFREEVFSLVIKSFKLTKDPVKYS